MEDTRAPKRLMALWRGEEAEDDLGDDGVEKDMRVLGVRSLKWRNMLDQAKAHPGL
ncbi:jg674, partial [Pararge aegeria aegeria]